MNRRSIWSIGLALAMAVSACAPGATPTPETVTVKETVVVAGTPEVREVVITATPEPAAPAAPVKGAPLQAIGDSEGGPDERGRL